MIPAGAPEKRKSAQGEIAAAGDAERLANMPIEQRLILNSPDAIVFISPTWNVEYANSEALKLIQKDFSEVAGSDFRTAFPELASPLLQQRFLTTLAEQSETDFEVKVGKRWLQIRVARHPDGLALYGRDLSNLKATEQTLHEREAELHDFFENGHVALHWCGPDGTILWANDVELSMLGYPADEYIGRGIGDFHVDQPISEDILSRLSSHEELHDYQSRLRRKDGSILDVSINSSVYFKDGNFIHTRCFTKDITAEKAKAEIQHRLAAIVQSSDDAIISKDLNGVIKSWNKSAERLFGYTAAEAIGQYVAALLIPDDRQEEETEILSRLRRGERVEHFETRRKRKDGSLLDISLTISPVKDANGKIVGASKIARDITEQVKNVEALRNANDALKRSNNDLEQFANSASHDLQEPLRMVSTYSEMLRMKYGSSLDGRAKEFIGFIQEGNQRMERLLHDLRTYTHAALAPEEPDAVIDAQVALHDALASLKGAIDESGAEITWSSLPPVRIAKFQLDQLFRNLIGNAIRYRRAASPIIKIEAEDSGNEWKFSVSDNGIGIEPEYKEQIFGIFKRLHTASEYPGTGMGLAICQRVVERAGGRIWVESEAGGGSIFYFTLPRPDRH